jgi:predicted GNAT superfamily acetyltransferase
MISRLVTDKEEGMVQAILRLEGLFPEKIGYGEWDVWDNLQNPNNMNIVAEDGGEIIGYVLCIPQEEAVAYLKKDDPFMENCGDRCYVDQIAVVEDKRGGKAFRFLVAELAVEAKKRGFTKWSSHLLAELEGVLQRMYEGKVTLIRKTKMSAYGDHELVYMEGWI